MNKELEALRQLFEFSKSSASLSRSQSYEDLKILNEALKQKEKLEKFVYICKKKLVNFDFIWEGDNFTLEHYNKREYLEEYKLTEEEFSFLKEMLK